MKKMKRYNGEEDSYVDDSDLSDEVERTTYAGGAKYTTTDTPEFTPVKKSAPVAAKAKVKNLPRSSAGKGIYSADFERIMTQPSLRKTLGVKGMKSGGSVSSASSRADGIAQRGKTRGRYI